MEDIEVGVRIEDAEVAVVIIETPLIVAEVAETVTEAVAVVALEAEVEADTNLLTMLEIVLGMGKGMDTKITNRITMILQTTRMGSKAIMQPSLLWLDKKQEDMGMEIRIVMATEAEMRGITIVEDSHTATNAYSIPFEWIRTMCILRHVGVSMSRR